MSWACGRIQSNRDCRYSKDSQHFETKVGGHGNSFAIHLPMVCGPPYLSEPAFDSIIRGFWPNGRQNRN
jgi:hypothetical protein